MKVKALAFMFMILWVAPALAEDVTSKDFEVQTTRNLINLCTVSQRDPLYNQAINFCHGYLVGAFHYYAVANEGPKATKLVCMPEKRPSRNQAVQMFVDWALAHPQYMNEKPVETEFRFLMETWPCTGQNAR